MATFQDIENKINELRAILTEVMPIWPSEYTEQKDRIERLIAFFLNRLQSDYKALLMPQEITGAFNSINAACMELLNYKQTKNAGYINNTIGQLNNFRNYLNIIPSETLNTAQLRQLISQCRQAKDTNKSALEELQKNQKKLNARTDEILDKSIKLLSDTTTGVLAMEFEKKRLTEIGGKKPKNKFYALLKFPQWGTYQKDTFGLFFILALMVVVILYGGIIFDRIFDLSAIESLPGKMFIRMIARISLLGPLIWLAIIQNKKMNLSKKLAEEYWHKEIVAKTFVGLADQIDKTTEGDTAKDLRIKLLELTLDAIAKNPADCIGNHNESDNPMRSILKVSQKGLNKANDLLEVAKKAKETLQ